MIKVGIVGGTGYTGVELLRLLAQHPQAEVMVITSRSEDGVKVTDLYPNLRGHYDGLAFSVPDVAKLGVAMWSSSRHRTAWRMHWPESCFTLERG
ncbi:N-acetyl-gamma-glutamyl-phosphate reductase [Stutzerimonas stutzeri]